MNQLTPDQLKLKIEMNLRGLTETNGLNHLQSRGVISDNVINLDDVWDGDCIRAVEWLKERNK